tara:strand:+ start:245 stop:565 length:321 start_codon:yes stop_codon:yes gene_type:complete
MKDNGAWEIRVTLNDIFVALVSLPMVFIFFLLSYQLINQAFVNEAVRQDIESYIAVLGILSGPSYMAISRFFDRWNAEQEERVEAMRRMSKTEDDLKRMKLKGGRK